MRRISKSGYTIGLVTSILGQVGVEKVMNDNEIVEFNSAMAAFESKNFARAAQSLGPFAEQGNPDAQHRLAIMYQTGLGVAVNELMAVKWMKAAAEQGHAVAQHGLGFMYLEGECVEKEPAKAAEWFEKAANQGLAGSMTTLALMYEEGNGVEKDMDKAQEWYKKAGF